MQTKRLFMKLSQLIFRFILQARNWTTETISRYLCEQLTFYTS